MFGWLLELADKATPPTQRQRKTKKEEREIARYNLRQAEDTPNNQLFTPMILRVSLRVMSVVDNSASS